MDLYDMNHEKVIYTALDFIEFVIEKAKTKIHPDFLAKEFNFYNLSQLHPPKGGCLSKG